MMERKLKTTDKRRWFEGLAVILTGALKYVLMDWLELRVFFISSACLFWLFYILKRYRTDKEIMGQWGFRETGFRRTFIFGLPLFFLILIGIFLPGSGMLEESLTWNLIAVMGLYPLWGVIQQFLMIGLIAGNLRCISTLNLTESKVVFMVSILFAFAHYPDWPLMGFTFVMELVFITAYFRWRNLWALGLLHGWLGALFLYLVMQRNLWNELWVIF
jgi:hypothetical protein